MVRMGTRTKEAQSQGFRSSRWERGTCRGTHPRGSEATFGGTGVWRPALGGNHTAKAHWIRALPQETDWASLRFTQKQFMDGAGRGLGIHTAEDGSDGGAGPRWRVQQRGSRAKAPADRTGGLELGDSLTLSYLGAWMPLHPTSTDQSSHKWGQNVEPFYITTIAVPVPEFMILKKWLQPSIIFRWWVFLAAYTSSRGTMRASVMQRGSEWHARASSTSTMARNEYQFGTWREGCSSCLLWSADSNKTKWHDWSPGLGAGCLRM